MRLAVPASAGYVVLARLALTAVSRLTPLPPEDVADMKLAVTEAATALLGGDGDGGPMEGQDGGLRFSFEVTADELCVDVGRDPVMELPEDEAELSRAIIAATVDRFESWPGGVRLAKRLPRAPG